MTKFWRAACLLLLTGLLMGPSGLCVRAWAADDTQSVATTSEIHANSAPYHFEWNGSEGSFSQDALGVDTARKVPLVFLHSDPGPKGYAKYLAWFLARDGQAFSLVWCYLNDSGTDFYCWLYRYPVNQLTNLHFTGTYHFTAPTEPVAPVVASDLKTANTPHYSGPDFVFGNWTRRSGTLPKLDLRPVRAATFAVPLTDSNGPDPNAGRSDNQIVKTLTALRAYPLHEMHVPGGNGWRTAGWRELHALALDAANDPYYLILYTYTTRGYVVDLKRAQTYVTDFGQKVVFSQSPSTFGAEEQVTGPPDVQVTQYNRHEITFTATGSSTNPYNEVYLDVQFRSPGGKLLTVPGFWDGGDIWRARISPNIVGKWTWKTVSSDPGMRNQEGGFTCISSTEGSKGFLTVNKAPGYRHHFATADGTPFLPVFVAYPIHHIPNTSAPDKTASRSGGARLVGSDKETVAAAPADEFSRFQRDVDALAALGFNRFIGEYLIDPTQFAARTQHNEGGAPFVGYDPDHINPGYFQAMDRRMAYANDKGIMSDVGIGELDAELLNLLDEAQIRRLWRYVIARYASYNVCWMPFGRAIGKPLPIGADALIESLQRMVLRNDPVNHLLTMVTPGGVEVLKKPSRPGTRGADVAAPGTAPGSATSEKVGHVGALDQPAASGGFIHIPEAQTSGAAGQAPNAGGRGAPPNPGGNRDALPGLGGLGQVPGPGASGRGRLEGGGGRSGSQDSSGGYIQSPSGLPLGPAPAVVATSTPPQVIIDHIPSWMETVTFNGGPISELAAVYSLGKPIVIYDRSAPSEPGAVRYRLWTTQMSGGYWAGAFASDRPGNAVDSPETRWTAYCARLFEKTRFWRLVPHNDMLGGIQESAFERRRRRQAEAAAAKEAAAQDAARGIGPDAEDPLGADVKPTAGPIYLLADPGWEYVVYFQRGGTLTLDLLEATGRVSYVWFNPRTGEFSGSDTVMGGAFRTFRAPDDNDWALYISRR